MLNALITYLIIFLSYNNNGGRKLLEINGYIYGIDCVTYSWIYAAAIAAAKTETESQIAAHVEVADGKYATKTELTEAVSDIENDLLAYAKKDDVNTELVKKVENATIAHAVEAVEADPENGIEAVQGIPEGVTKDGTTLKIVIDAPTRAETIKLIADKVADVTGGESAADVKLSLEAEITRSTAKDTAHDTALATLMSTDASVVGSVAEAKALAQKGVDDAAAVAADLVIANTAISNNAREIETVKGTITTVNETLSGKVTALEAKDTEIAGLISGLDTTVKGHTATITEHGGKITALENQTGPYDEKIVALEEITAEHTTQIKSLIDSGVDYTQLAEDVSNLKSVVESDTTGINALNNKMTVVQEQLTDYD